MKILRWVKWIFSLLILISALTGIIWGTNYVLKNKGIREDVSEKVKKTIEKVTSNERNTNLSEIYNVYLNEEKHKLKLEYQLVSKTDGSRGVSLYVYFDGKNVLESEVVSLEEEISTIHEVFLIEDVNSVIKINEASFKILTDGEMQYLLFDMGIIQDSAKEYYYLVNDNGDLMNEPILISDSKKEYLTAEGEVFNNYYDDEDSILAKVEGNDIYVLEEKSSKKKLDLVEYKYYFKEGKLEKEVIQTYEDVKLTDKVIIQDEKE